MGTTSRVEPTRKSGTTVQAIFGRDGTVVRHENGTEIHVSTGKVLSFFVWNSSIPTPLTTTIQPHTKCSTARTAYTLVCVSEWIKSRLL